ncbi:cupin domain-containing protein [Oryzibacter oryziterrae]|uniref:cupin domain-containing protein n=1 Tax=Oryzibacter oryziterrae TaxID=2766474 RepID=UPI001F479A43|nr:cupin domain-containing protein [Oryzibacter oryziterrae]
MTTETQLGKSQASATPKPVVNIDEVELVASSVGDIFEERYAPLSDVVGGRMLGYNLTIVPPGKRSCPFHSHRANEEMFFIVAGEGTYRFGEESYPVKAGDVCAAPAGGPETAHHLINTGTRDLKYLGVSTVIYPDICEYPDSGKFLATTGPGAQGHRFRFIGRKTTSLDYYDGEI